MVTLRWATGRGDLIMTWERYEVKIQGRMATAAEREKLTAWAKEHGLTIEGNLEGVAVIHGEPAGLKKALSALVRKDVGAVGYAVYAVDKKGRGKVLTHHSEVDLSKFKEVAKVPQVKGG